MAGVKTIPCPDCGLGEVSEVITDKVRIIIKCEVCASNGGFNEEDKSK